MKRKWDEAFQLVESQIGQDISSLPANKVFKSKFGLPQLVDPDFWLKWPKLSFEEAMKTKCDIKADVLGKLAEEVRFPYPNILCQILKDIREGASLGMSQGNDIPSDSANSLSAFVRGGQISDTICKIITQKFIMGPFEDSNLPFEENRFSGIMAKIKPDNSARMILDLCKGSRHYVNSGIDVSDYPYTYE